MSNAAITSFPPVIDAGCRILILGTMPGAESLRKQEYYGYKMNQFWNIIFALFDEIPATDYQKKTSFLLCKHIALWDVLKSCEREGSSDSNIKNPVANDFRLLFQNYPGIKKLYFNGKNAEALFKKHVACKIDTSGLCIHTLPSTSPANSMTGFKDKLEKWKAILC